MLSITEENYLKSIYKLAEKQPEHSFIHTNAIADMMRIKASSATDMIKRLAQKELLNYTKYKGVQLTNEGKKSACQLIRNHRLWEVFLLEKLNFKWTEVHDIAEQLEHIKSSELIDRLEAYLEYPKFDPHGDPIPDRSGNYIVAKDILLINFPINQEGIITGVKNTSSAFLEYLDSVKIGLGTRIKTLKHLPYDDSLQILVNNNTEVFVSEKVSKNILMKKMILPNPL